jgi:ergothioneine biosynthesis protein EgtB
MAATEPRPEPDHTGARHRVVDVDRRAHEAHVARAPRRAPAPAARAVEVDRDDLDRRYREVRARTERLAQPLSAEDQTVQTMPDVSPTKWHRAHVTWFFETFVLSGHEPGFAKFDDSYWYLFNSYYESVGERYPRPDRGLITRPGVEDVRRYRSTVDERVRALLTSLPEPVLAGVRPVVELGFHHEQQHQELLLMDIKHVLSHNPLAPVYLPAKLATATPTPMGWVDVPGGLVEVGYAGDGFHFDNEGPRHRVFLEPYRLADRLVTNGEWLEFMADGGYRRHELWLSEGWHLSRAQGWRAPLYWISDGDSWYQHTLGGTRPVDPDEPVCHVSFYEAEAYASWAGARLPSEAEWEHAAVLSGREVAGNFADSGAYHPVPAGPPDGGLRQLYGDCWEWTSSAYHPYPGYRPPAGAIGEYNGKFMANQMVLRGGCAFTPPDHARPTYRNFFPHHSRWMLSGVRLADGGAPTTRPAVVR